MENATIGRRLQQLGRRLTAMDSHVRTSYRAIRRSMGWVSVVFPFLLWAGGVWFHGFARSTSMSAYYHSPMRDWFVGILFFIGLALIAYKGYTLMENWLLNVAGALALGIAVIPMESACCPNCPRWTAHGALSLAFFVVIMAVIWACSRSTLPQLKDVSSRKTYKILYILLAALILLAGVLALSTALSFQANAEHCKPNLFPWEATMVITFGVYWLIKTHEITRSGLDDLAIDEEYRARQ